MLAPHCVRALAIALLAAAAPCQQTRMQEIVGKHFEDLADPARARVAARTLTLLGGRVVPLLRERLDALQRGEQPYDSLLGAMVVLARMGKPGLEALPELIDVVENEGEGLGRQSMWALTRLAPIADEKQLSAIRSAQQLCVRRRQFRNCESMDLLGCQLYLARMQSERPETRVEILDAVVSRTHDLWRVLLQPACLQIAASPPTDRNLRTAMSEHLDELLALVLQRPSMPDEREMRDSFLADKTVSFAEARLALADGLRDARTARGMLGHWDADERLKSVAWLADHGTELQPREIADLCSVLWDGDAEVATASARAIAGFGKKGLFGLAPLLRRAGEDTAPELIRACLEASDAVVAAFAGDEAEPTVLAFAAALRGQSPTTAVDGKRPELLEAMHGLLWATPATALATLDALVEHGTPPATAATFALRASSLSDEAIARAALRWLAHHKKAFGQAEPQGITRIARLLRTHIPPGAHAAGTEAMTWLGTPREPTRIWIDDELPALTNQRRIVRVLVTAIADRPEALHGSLRTLTSYSSIAEDWIDQLEWQERESPWSVRASLFEEIRLLSVIGLAAAGLSLPELAELDTQRVREQCGVEPKDLAEWVRGKRDANTLKPWLAEVEERAQRKIGVKPEDWPAKW